MYLVFSSVFIAQLEIEVKYNGHGHHESRTVPLNNALPRGRERERERI